MIKSRETLENAQILGPSAAQVRGSLCAPSPEAFSSLNLREENHKIDSSTSSLWMIHIHTLQKMGLKFVGLLEFEFVLWIMVRVDVLS